jgi:hypothetical protein
MANLSVHLGVSLRLTPAGDFDVVLPERDDKGKLGSHPNYLVLDPINLAPESSVA